MNNIPSSLNVGTYLQCSSRLESNHMYVVMIFVRPTPINIAKTERFH